MTILYSVTVYRSNELNWYNIEIAVFNSKGELILIDSNSEDSKNTMFRYNLARKIEKVKELNDYEVERLDFDDYKVWKFKGRYEERTNYELPF